jgi:hypothetical protein
MNPVNIISTIYPPPTSKEIKQIHYCMNLNKIFLLLDSGIICVYELDADRQNSASLQKFQHSYEIKDKMG